MTEESRGSKSRGWLLEKVAVPIAIALVAATGTYIFGPWLALKFGVPKSPFLNSYQGIVDSLTTELTKSGYRFEYIEDKVKAYKKAEDIISNTVKKGVYSILNVRASKPHREVQDTFYLKIVQAMADNPTLRITRIITYESDRKLENVRWFLEQLGTNARFALYVSMGRFAFPSCVITEREAIIGFNDADTILAHAMYFNSPNMLVNDILRSFETLARSKYSVLVKPYDQSVEPSQINSRIRNLKAMLNKLDVEINTPLQ